MSQPATAVRHRDTDADLGAGAPIGHIEEFEPHGPRCGQKGGKCDRHANRILTTHVGSLVRPPKLVEFLKKIEAGEPYDKAAYEACLKESIEEVVRQQVEAGIDIVSDGEFSKGRNWAFYVHDRLSGLATRPATPEELKDPMASAGGGQDRVAFPEFYAEYDRASGLGARLGKRFVVNGPLTYNDATVKRDIAKLKAAAAKANADGAFLPVVAPASALPGAKNEHYADEKSAAVRARRLPAPGIQGDRRCRPLRADRRRLPALHAREDGAADERGAVPRLGADAHRRAQPRAARHSAGALALSHLLGQLERPARLRRAAEGHRRPAAAGERRRTTASRQANPRHEHEWTVWQSAKLPAGKMLIPGVISHATNIVEHPELVAQRLVRLAKIVGRENVMGGTDCGFAQSPFAQRVHPEHHVGEAALAVGGREDRHGRVVGQGGVTTAADCNRRERTAQLNGRMP